MKKLTGLQSKVLKTLILLWNETDREINQQAIINRIGIDSARLSHIIAALARKGYVEQIAYTHTDKELKPLRHPDGADFLAIPAGEHQIKKPAIVRVPRRIVFEKSDNLRRSCYCGNVVPLTTRRRRDGVGA